MLSKIFKEFNILFFVIVIFCPVNIIYYIGSENSIAFNAPFNYVFQILNITTGHSDSLAVTVKSYLALPMNIMVGIILFIFILKEPNLYLNNSKHTFVYLVFYILINILILYFLLFNKIELRLLKNFISANLLFFFLYSFNIFLKRFSYDDLKKIEIYFLSLLSMICLSNILINILFHENNFSDLIKGQFFLGLQIAHYLDYFPIIILFVIGYLFGNLRLKSSHINYLIYLIFFISWFIYFNGFRVKGEFIIENKGSTLVFFVFIILYLLTFKIKFLKKFVINNLYLLYLPFLLFLYLTIFHFISFYEIDHSIADRLRTFEFNLNQNINLFLPIVSSRDSTYINFHNDFLDYYYLFGLFSLIIFNIIFLKLRKIIKINYSFGLLLIIFFSLLSLVQNNLLNPYLIIIFSFLLAFTRNVYNKKIIK